MLGLVERTTQAFITIVSQCSLRVCAYKRPMVAINNGCRFFAGAWVLYSCQTKFGNRYPDRVSTSPSYRTGSAFGAHQPHHYADVAAGIVPVSSCSSELCSLVQLVWSAGRAGSSLLESIGGAFAGCDGMRSAAPGLRSAGTLFDTADTAANGDDGYRKLVGHFPGTDI